MRAGKTGEGGYLFGKSGGCKLGSHHEAGFKVVSKEAIVYIIENIHFPLHDKKIA